MTTDEWIIEGVYYAWVQESFEKADIIYVLDIPKHIYKSRIIIRFLKRKLGNDYEVDVKVIEEAIWEKQFENFEILNSFNSDLPKINLCLSPFS